MIRKIPVELITTLLVILFTYTALSKVLDVDTFRKQMLNQPLPETLKQNLVWFVPVSEVTTSIFLIFKPLRLYGFYWHFC